MIDRKKFDENFQFFEKDVIIEIINIFDNEYDERFDTLTRNIAENDFDKLKFNAHSLKGVVANFMDPEVIRLSQRFDEMAKNRESNGLLPLFEELKQHAAALRDELLKIREELNSLS